jgi:crotonobetainyl-CoA:carnitine CoA-transferase CaiB-like acyl-CoA transferase
VEVPDPIAGTIAVSGDYWHFSRSEVPVGSTPTVGQHTDEILGGLLGFSSDKLATLREERVIV